MSKKSKNFIPQKSNTYQSPKTAQNGSKKKKWDKTHTIVFILILFWSIGSILGSIGFANSCNSVFADTSCVVYADEVVTDYNNFTFITVPINLPTSTTYNCTTNDTTSNSLGSIEVNNADTFFNFEVRFIELYNNIGLSGQNSLLSKVTFTDNAYTIVMPGDNFGKLSTITSYIDYIGTFNNDYYYARFNIATGYIDGLPFNLNKSINNYHVNYTNFNTFTLTDMYKYVFYDTYNELHDFHITSSRSSINLYFPRNGFTSNEFYKVTFSTHNTLISSAYEYRVTYTNVNNESFYFSTNVISKMNDYSIFSYDRFLTFDLSEDTIYQTGYDDGYANGYNDGATTGYQNGLEQGKQVGYYEGKQDGILEGSNGNYTFLGLMSSVIDAPIRALSGLLEFEILGINFSDFFFGILTACLFIAVCKIVIKSVV